MALKLGTTALTALYLGSTALSTAYLGSVQVYDAGGVAFDPASLFASGEEGVWYEPATTTAFLSDTDLTPCGYGDACGLLLDKSQGAGYSGGSFTGLGDEIIDTSVGPAGSTFAVRSTLTDAGSGFWTMETTGTVGEYGATTATVANAFTVNTIYEVTVEVLEFSVADGSHSMWVRWSDGQNSNVLLSPDPLANITAAGTYKNTIRANRDTITIIMRSGLATIGDYVTFKLSVRELPGNHATQTTFDNRPILARVPEGGRRNELVSTATLATQSVTVTAAERTLSFKGAGTVTLSGASTAGPLVGTGASDRVTLTFTPSAGPLTLTVSGTVTDAQLELGATATAYQLVADADGYDVTESGVDSLDYLSFNGTNNYLTPGAIDFTSTDAMSIFSAVRKLIDARQCIVENTAAGNTGAFSHNAGGGVGVGTTSQYNAFAKGSATGKVDQYAVSAAFPAPITNVFTSTHDISDDLSSIRVDGAASGTDGTGEKGLGNFRNIVVWVGARNYLTGDLWFTGHIYGLIVRGAASDATEISNTETYLANRSGVTL